MNIESNGAYEVKENKMNILQLEMKLKSVMPETATIEQWDTVKALLSDQPKEVLNQLTKSGTPQIVYMAKSVLFDRGLLKL